MKLRHPALFRVAAFLLTWIARPWMATLRYRMYFSDGVAHPTDPSTSRYIYAVWHESLFVAAGVKARAHTLISQHADGELIAQACRQLRIGVVRGSSTRGAEEGLLRLAWHGRRTHLVVTPDGPRGPRRQIKRGLAFLAAHTGLPVVGTGVGYSHALRLRSWDRFALPLPWSTVYCVATRPIHVPPGQARADLEHYRRLIEEQLQQAAEAAEAWAARASGRTVTPTACERKAA